MFAIEPNNRLLVYQTTERNLTAAQADSAKQRFRDNFLSNNLHDVIIDLSNVVIVSSSFIGWLVQVKKQMTKSDGQLILCSVSEHVQEQLRRMHLLPFLTIVKNIKEARQQAYGSHAPE